MHNKVANRIKNIMSAVLEISSDSVDDNSSPDTIESWDSLKELNLVVALEEEFDLTFNDNEIFEITSYPSIKRTITKNLGQL